MTELTRCWETAVPIPELTYHWEGDVLIPDLTLTPEDLAAKPLAKYGRMRRRYLKEHKSPTYNELLLTGKLWPHLNEVDEAAQSRLDLMIPQLAKAQGVTEDLKDSDPMNWIGLMNNIQAQVEEAILAELVYV